MKIFNCILTLLLFAGIISQGYPCYQILCKDPLFTQSMKVRKPDSAMLKAYCDSILSINYSDQRVRKDVGTTGEMAAMDSINFQRYKCTIEKYGYIAYEGKYFETASQRSDLFTKIWVMEMHYADSYNGLELLNTIDKAIDKGYCTKLDLYTAYITYAWRQFEFRHDRGNFFIFPDSRFRNKYGSELAHVHQLFLKHAREQDSLLAYVSFRLKKENDSTNFQVLENTSFFNNGTIAYLLQKNKAILLNTLHNYFRGHKNENIYDHDVSIAYFSKCAIGASSVVLNELHYTWY